MNDKIIKSSLKKERNPLIAFLLSFFFTGAGETYNGDLSKGLIIFFIKIIALMILPIIIILKASDSYLVPFVFTVFISLSLHLFSPVYASLKSYREKTAARKKYNNIYFYLIFILLNSLITIYTISIVYTTFGIVSIKDDNNIPSLSYGDIILYLKYHPHDFKKGDLIINDNMKISRIIGMENENFKIIKDKILIDNFPLEREILSETDMKKYSIEFGEKFIFEINNRRKYPAISDESLLSKSKIKDITIKKMHFLAGVDNRSVYNQFEEIPANRVISRVEGIIFSKNYKRILTLPFDTQKND
jgi:TM2 domain-containing membrane protein YozV